MTSDADRELPTSHQRPSGNPLLALLDQSNGRDEGANRALDRLLLSLEPILRRSLLTQFRTLPTHREFVRDAMQEVLLKVAMRCPILSFESDHALVHWALEVARTTGLDCFRRARYRYRAKEVSVDDALSLVDESYVEPKEMETHYWAHGVGRIILETYDELPDLPAHLVWLRLIVRTSWSEAGEILGVSAKAAQNRYQRTLRALRRRIELRLSALSTDERVALTAQLMSRHPTLARPALSPSGEQGVIS